MARMRVMWTLLLCLTLPSCQPPEPETPPATVPDSTPPPTTPPPTESFAIPEVIDEPYVERVLNRLYEIESDALRRQVVAGEVTADVEVLLRAISTPEQADLELQAARDLSVQGLDTIRRPPGDSRFLVDRVLTGTPECIWVVGLRDFDEVTVTPIDRSREQDFVQLVPDPDPASPNETGWRINDLRTRDVGAEEPDPCVG